MMLFLLFLPLTLMICQGKDRYVKVHFPKSTETNYPRLELEDTLPTMQELTSCLWLRTTKYNEKYDVIISYHIFENNKNIDEFLLDFNVPNATMSRIRFIMQARLFSINCLEVSLSKWQHLCVTWSSISAVCEAFLNGKSCGKVNVTKGLEIRSGGRLIFGQEQDKIGDGFDAHQAFVGDIADVQIWDEVLESKQIYQLSRCEGRKFSGNIFSWMENSISAKDGPIISSTVLCLD